MFGVCIDGWLFRGGGEEEEEDGEKIWGGKHLNVRRHRYTQQQADREKQIMHTPSLDFMTEYQPASFLLYYDECCGCC